MNEIYFLHNNHLNNLNAFGKKASGLILMAREGFQVPNGFILNYQSKISDQDLATYIDKIGGFPIAVRSSGNLEDLNEMSFAGLYETFLEINNLEDCKKSIERCFQAANSERVQTYLDRNHIKISTDDLKKSMNVLIQKMITPKISGVLFTLNPISGKEEHLLLECVSGLGERLVSGEITPTRYILKKYPLKDIRHANDIQIETEEIGADGIQIDLETLTMLHQTSLKIAASFKHPQDIEWCLDQNNQLWFLQSRPITSIGWRKDVPELTNADFKDGGVSASVCTPLMYSLYQHCLDQSMGQYFYKIGLKDKFLEKDWIYFHYGRAYWNASRVKESLFNIPDFDEKKFDEDLGIQKNYGNSGPHKTKLSLKTLLNAVPVLIKLNLEYKHCREMVQDFPTTFEIQDLKWKNIINKFSNLTDVQFFNYFERMYFDFYIITEKKYFRTIYNNSNYQSDFKNLLSKINKKYELNISILELMQDLGEVGHLKIQKDLKILAMALKQHGKDSAEVKSAFNRFLQHHYHHADRELDLRCPRWGENPEKIWQMLEIFSDQHEYQHQFETLINELKTKINNQGFFKKLEESRWFLSHREKMREYSTRAYFIVRQFILELGKRLKQNKIIHESEDIFFLTIDELLYLIKENSPHDKVKTEIAWRIINFQALQELHIPNEFGGNVEQRKIINLDDNCLRGIASSHGQFTGIAYVANNLEEAQKMPEGHILITKFTDPGWTPTLARAKAVVCEVGGLLSHAAVISREYRMPAVLNVSGATKFLKTGMNITVDGTEGVIKIESHLS